MRLAGCCRWVDVGISERECGRPITRVIRARLIGGPMPGDGDKPLDWDDLTEEEMDELLGRVVESLPPPTPYEELQTVEEAFGDDEDD